MPELYHSLKPTAIHAAMRPSMAHGTMRPSNAAMAWDHASMACMAIRVAIQIRSDKYGRVHFCWKALQKALREALWHHCVASLVTQDSQYYELRS